MSVKALVASLWVKSKWAITSSILSQARRTSSVGAAGALLCFGFPVFFLGAMASSVGGICAGCKRLRER